MGEHTKEPWLVMGPCAQWETARIFSGSRYIGSIGNSDETESETRANADRIVACVNACAGISDETLAEWGKPGGPGMWGRAASRIQAQHDELLAIVKQVADWRVQPYAGARYECLFCGSTTDDHSSGCISIDARAAIANAEKPPCD